MVSGVLVVAVGLGVASAADALCQAGGAITTCAGWASAEAFALGAWMVARGMALGLWAQVAGDGEP